MAEESTSTTLFPKRPPIDGPAAVVDLQWLLEECDERMITDGVKWAADILAHVKPEWISAAVEIRAKQPPNILLATALGEQNRFAVLARPLMIGRDFHRAAFFLKRIKEHSEKHRFLYYWCRYLGIVHENLENEVEAIERKASDQDEDEQMAELFMELSQLHDESPGSFDVFMHYLFGKIQQSLKLPDLAKKAYISAIRAEPRFWPAWEELVPLVESIKELGELKMLAGNRWYGDWFEARVHPHLQVPYLGAQIAEELMSRGFGNAMPLLLAYSGVCYNQMHEHDPAIDRLLAVRDIDPFRIEYMNILSDSLYIRGERVHLDVLSHSFFKTHKYFWETCCIVANYYSMRGDHEPSIRFLQRALKLNPNSASSWILIGHEFMELKNNSAACMSYRKAIEINPNDHRGWYGLGQLYDILKMHNFSLFYYQQAHKCKPMDSRMLVALGEVYQKANRIPDAEKCFIKAFKVGDVEGTALLLLAKLYESGGQKEEASVVYEKYLTVYYDARVEDPNVPSCTRFLAKFYLDRGDLEAATCFGQRCIEYESVREEGLFVLRQVAQRRQRMLPRHQRPAPQATGLLPAGAPSDPALRTPNVVADPPATPSEAPPPTPSAQPPVAPPPTTPSAQPPPDDVIPEEDIHDDVDMALSDGEDDESF